jgi:hypothetical protein
MAKLYDASSNLLSKSVQVLPDKDPLKIENRLLSGDYDQQIIGDPALIYEVTFFCTYANMLLIQQANATGASLTLDHEGSSLVCKIREKPKFRLDSRGIAANRYYKGDMTLLEIV